MRTLLICLLLTGCASNPTALIPISTPCKATVPAPVELRFNPPYTKVFDAVRDLMGDREALIGENLELRAIAEGCTR